MRIFAMMMVAMLAFLGSFLRGADALPARQKPLPVAEFYKHFEAVPVDKDMGELFGSRVYLGTAGNAANYNSLTLGWGATGVLWPLGNGHGLQRIEAEQKSVADHDGAENEKRNHYPHSESQGRNRCAGYRRFGTEERSGKVPADLPKHHRGQRQRVRRSGRAGKELHQ